MEDQLHRLFWSRAAGMDPVHKNIRQRAVSAASSSEASNTQHWGVNAAAASHTGWFCRFCLLSSSLQCSLQQLKNSRCVFVLVQFRYQPLGGIRLFVWDLMQIPVLLNKTWPKHGRSTKHLLTWLWILVLLPVWFISALIAVQSINATKRQLTLQKLIDTLPVCWSS